MNASDIPAAPAIDWNAVLEESTGLLRDYLRIDTTNPPGGEEAGAIFLRDVLEREGIACKLYDAGSSRVSLSARLEGRGGAARKPLVLLSHIDVVPVEREHWKHDPFGGEIVDDVIWGRGALDMKGMGIMELMTMVVMRRHGIEPDRDIVLVAVADEEEGGRKGVHYLQEKHPEILASEWTFNEGAYGFSEFMGRKSTIVGLAPSEKSPCWLRLRAKGHPGHASVPHDKNALAHLVRAIARVEEQQRQVELTPAVEAMLRTMIAKGFLPEDLDPTDHETLEALGSLDAHLRAITHDTVSMTSFHAGGKINVIPAGAEATLDCRLLPTTDPDEFVRAMGEAIDDPMVEIERVYEHVSGMSSLDTPVAAVAEAVVKDRLGDEAFLMPLLTPGFTDSHAFRSAGGQAYGFTPALLTREELSTIHGHNERLSRANLSLGTEVLFETVRRLTHAGA
jgi:acetylornithine deacetylase/succinyl-diaminopimelate desuccinylase-like protein